MCVEDVLDKDKEQQEGVGTIHQIPQSSGKNISLASCFLVTIMHVTLLLNLLSTMFVHDEILEK